MFRTVQKPTHLPHTEKMACAFCKGTGKDPFGQLFPGSTCQVCSGRQIIFILTPYKTCTYCHGSGVEFSTQNTCTVCQGRGVQSVGKERSRKAGCRTCQGTGMAPETNLPCTGCHGLGLAAHA